MDYFYNTQNNFKSMDFSNSLDFTKTKFKNNNFFNTFKSQHSNFSTFRNTDEINSSKEKNIYNIIKLQYTLVQDFLTKINLSYTLNSFNNEIKSILNPTTPFSSEEISKLIDINKDNDNDDLNPLDKNSFLDTIKNTYLYNLIFSKSNLFKVEKEVQTLDIINNEDNNHDVKRNNFFSTKNTKIDGAILIRDIDEQLKKIDEKYNNKLKNENLFPQSYLVESKFTRYKNELDRKYKDDLKNEIERIKTVEVGKVIIQENQKYLEKIEDIRNELESKYELKLKELNEKEKEIKNKGNSLQDEYREKTKELMEEYQQKVNNLNQKESNFNQKCIKELKNIKEKKINLDKKEKELYILKKDYDKEIQNEIEKLKNEFKQIFKEQLEKIKSENEKELEKAKSKLKYRKINYDMSGFRDENISDINYKEFISIKEQLSNLIQKINKNNKNNLIVQDDEMEKLEKNLDYYEQITELELRLNEITKKSKFKLYNINKNEEEKNISDFIIKDENIKKKYDELENEQNELNDYIEKDFKKFMEDEIPKMQLNKEELDIIKNNNYNMILFNIAKDKELNNIYKNELEKENVKNKIKYLEEINKNAKEAFEREINKQKYIIIDEKEMERHKQLFLKLYRQKREQQKIDELNKQKEKIRQRELKEKEIKEKEEKEKEKRQKSKDKKDEDKSFSKSILPPVRNRKSSVLDNISELIISKKEKMEDKKNIEEDEDYGSGDFVDISKEENKSKSKTKSKIEISKKEEKEKNDDDHDLSGKIDMILNESHTDKVSELNEKDYSESYNDFETSNALDMKGINTIHSEQEKEKKITEENENESSDSRF